MVILEMETNKKSKSEEWKKKHGERMREVWAKRKKENKIEITKDV